MAAGQQFIPIDLSYKLDCFHDLTGRVAIITGGSRGIGRACALKLASLGCNIVIAAKTTEPKPNLPGTIYTVADECKKLGVRAIGIKIDMRDGKSLEKCAEETVKEFGRIDILINNASALWWQEILDTPEKRYDMIHSINARGTFLMTKACLPHMKKNNFGRVITMSPPIARKGFKGMTAYNISKMGMTMVAMGVAEEFEGQNITGNSLWPATVIESYASINFKLGDRSIWRKAEVIADATVGIICEDGSFTGHMLIDDEYLRLTGLKDDDFVRYRCDPEVEPPRALASHDWGDEDQVIRRGSVARLDQDMEKTKGFAKL
mmetsp:Transcript_14853/g.16797  ORF Transcript_14853/g.16797 Transcript_14853/m.16797 type:complete len:320 (-) Transcript_14853:1062-2021(-)